MLVVTEDIASPTAPKAPSGAGRYELSRAGGFCENRARPPLLSSLRPANVSACGAKNRCRARVRRSNRRSGSRRSVTTSRASTSSAPAHGSRTIALSLHCWQGDDVAGFEDTGEAIGGGLAVTGNYPGRARTADELRADLDKALSLIPGTHRLNLHASYAETGGKRVERNELEPAHFRNWIDWAESRRMGIDFNPTFFAHPRAADGFTLAHPDEAIRRFWIEHGIACRRIGEAIGAALGSPCVTNVWIPDGSKDTPVDRRGPRERLAALARRGLRRADRPRR